jgi:hypothetical protein
LILNNKEIGSALRVLVKLYYHKHEELKREAVSKKKDGWYFEQLKRHINLIRNTINMLEKLRKKGE